MKITKHTMDNFTLIKYAQEFFASLLIGGSAFLFSYWKGYDEGVIALIKKQDFSNSVVVYGFLLMSINWFLSIFYKMYRDIWLVEILAKYTTPILNIVGSLPAGLYRLLAGLTFMISLMTFARPDEMGGYRLAAIYFCMVFMWLFGALFCSGLQKCSVAMQEKVKSQASYYP